MYEKLFDVPMANESIAGTYSIVDKALVAANVPVPHGGISAITSFIQVVLPFVMFVSAVRLKRVVVTK